MLNAASLHPARIVKIIANHRFCISSLAGGSIDEARTRFFTKVSFLSYMSLGVIHGL